MSLLTPRITEKATLLQNNVDHPVYVFTVPSETNKHQVSQAVESEYKVKPLRVNVINNHGKKIVYRGRVAIKSGFKKALVYLKKGDKLEAPIVAKPVKK